MAITMTYDFGIEAHATNVALTIGNFRGMLSFLREWAQDTRTSSTWIDFSHGGNTLRLFFNLPRSGDKLTVMSYSVNGGNILRLADYNHPANFTNSLTKAITDIGTSTNPKQEITVFIFLTSESVRSEGVKKLFIQSAIADDIYELKNEFVANARSMASNNQVARGKAGLTDDIYAEIPARFYL